MGIKRKKLRIGSTARNFGEAAKHLQGDRFRFTVDFDVIGSTVPIARLVGANWTPVSPRRCLTWGSRVLSEILENREGVGISV